MNQLSKVEIQKTYGSLMSEAKVRVSSVNGQLALFDEPIDNHRSVLIAEFAYLQLRRITELTALGVLLAHNGDLTFMTNNLMKEWNTENLVKRLSRLRPEAFPQNLVYYDRGKGFVDVELPKNPNGKVQQDLSRIYLECCEKLHSGSLKFILDKRNKTYDVNFVREARDILATMLDDHAICLPDGDILHAQVNLGSPDGVQCRWLHPRNCDDRLR